MIFTKHVDYIVINERKENDNLKSLTENGKFT